MAMDLPTGSRCFIDTNIVYYAFVETPPLSAPCRAFIARLQQGEVVGYSSVPVLADAVHKTMIAEAASKRAGRANIVSWLGRHPDHVTALGDFADVAQRIGALNLQCLELDRDLLVEAAAISRQHGLLTNDAIIAALMRRHNLTDLVTNDDDFDAVPGLKVWKPR